MLTILIARRLVSRQIEAITSAKAALEASHDKSEFLARVTSELRTPLNAVIGYAELIQEEAVSQMARDDAQRIIVAARELSTMLSDIIDQSRIDVGKVNLKLEVVPIAGILAEVQGLMHPVASAAGVDITISQEATAAYACADSPLGQHSKQPFAPKGLQHRGPTRRFGQPRRRRWTNRPA